MTIIRPNSIAGITSLTALGTSIDFYDANGIGVDFNNVNLNNTSGVSTFSDAQVNTKLLIGSGTSTGTSDQTLQVTGGAYVSGNLGVGVTNPSNKVEIVTSTSDDGIVLTNSGANGGRIRLQATATGGRNYNIVSTATASGFGAGNLVITDNTASDAARLIIDSSGRITMPSQVYVYAASGTRSGTPNPVSPPHYPFISYSESYDVGSNFNASTGVFTAPVTGKYLIMGTWSQDANTGRTIGTLSFNGNYEEWVESNNQYNDVTGARVRVLSANDTVSFGSQQAALAAIAISIWLLG